MDPKRINITKRNCYFVVFMLIGDQNNFMSQGTYSLNFSLVHLCFAIITGHPQNKKSSKHFLVVFSFPPYHTQKKHSKILATVSSGMGGMVNLKKEKSPKLSPVLRD